MRSLQTARVPVLLGENNDKGSLFLINTASPPFEGFLGSHRNLISADKVRVVYPNILNNFEPVETVIHDIVFIW